MLDTWLRMVFSDRYRDLAMSGLDRPAAIRLSTSNSRPVRGGKGRGGVVAVLARQAGGPGRRRPGPARPAGDAAEDVTADCGAEYYFAGRDGPDGGDDALARGALDE